jgi:hypothetical protein
MSPQEFDGVELEEAPETTNRNTLFANDGLRRSGSKNEA